MLFLSYPIGVDIAGKPVKLNIFVNAVHLDVAVAQDNPSINGSIDVFYWNIFLKKLLSCNTLGIILLCLYFVILHVRG